ncbi:hypothetical protein [Bacillus sp. FJAT-47783]|uniref:hypothetical protein n=1 Tax=Bacillus sp. FJAT-47783 TaxID=2922712 RepID=UPI001FABF0EE|nr:hypothetical protein [Bacillus sp. FJAT-47783]
MVDNANLFIFEPNYIFVLLILLGIVYIVYFVISAVKLKLDFLTISTLGLSLLTYLLVGYYMVDSGLFVDRYAPENLVFNGYGFLELILLAFPYIFLALAVGLGNKRDK